MPGSGSIFQQALGFILILSSLGIVVSRKPVYSGLFFALTLFSVAAFYIGLSAEFIGVMQILVYAGAILVIFMFVIVLFQDAHEQIERFESASSPAFLLVSLLLFLIGLSFFTWKLLGMAGHVADPPPGFGSAQLLAEALYVEFFIPFEASVPLVLVALIGALFIGKKGK